MIRVDCSQKSEDFDRIASSAFSVLSLSGNAYVEVDFVSKDEIRMVNNSTRGVDKVTDVLSFPALESIRPFVKENYPYECNEKGEITLGNIVICLDVAKEQANEYGHSLQRETCYLFTHGLMHLLGYDHIEESDKALMRDAEERVLSAVGITREN